MAILLHENFRAVFYAPFYAAQATGAYGEAGVEVEMRNSPDPGTAGRALRSGEADVMWGGPLRVLLNHQADPDCDDVCFCSVVCRDPFFIVGRQRAPDFKLADLASARLGTVSEVPTPWLCLQDDLRRAGIDPATLSRRTGATMAENADALKRGELDAVQLFQPHAEQLLRDGLHLWYAAAARGPTAYTALIARRTTLDARREELQAMTRAMARTLAWFATTPAEDIAQLLAPFFPDLPTSTLASCLSRYRNLELWDKTPALQREGFDRLRTSMISGGALTCAASFEACVDNRFAELY